MTAFAHPSHIPVEVLAEVLQPDPYAMEKAGYLLGVWRSIPAQDVERVFWTLDAIVNADRDARPIRFSVGRAPWSTDLPLYVEIMWLTQSPNEPTLSYWRSAEGYKWFVSTPIFPSMSAVFSSRMYPELTMAAMHHVLGGHHSADVVTRAYVFVKSTLDPGDYTEGYLNRLATSLGRVYVDGEYQLIYWPAGDVRTAPSLVLDRHNGEFTFELVADAEVRIRAQIDEDILHPREPMRYGLAPNLPPDVTLSDWVLRRVPEAEELEAVVALREFASAETLRMFSSGERFVLLPPPFSFGMRYLQFPLVFDDTGRISDLGRGWPVETGDTFTQHVNPARFPNSTIAIYPRHTAGSTILRNAPGFFVLAASGEPVYWFMRLE